MLADRETLEAMKMGDLFKLAAEVKAEMAGGESKAQLIDRIMIKVAEHPPAIQDTPQSQLEASTAVKSSIMKATTIEEVKTALNPFILRGMKLYHRPEDNSWLIRLRLKNSIMRDTNTGEIKHIERWREDSGTLAQPLETIRRCARVLMANAPAPKEMEPDRDATKGMVAIA